MVCEHLCQKSYYADYCNGFWYNRTSSLCILSSVLMKKNVSIADGPCKKRTMEYYEKELILRKQPIHICENYLFCSVIKVKKSDIVCPCKDLPLIRIESHQVFVLNLHLIPIRSPCFIQKICVRLGQFHSQCTSDTVFLKVCLCMYQFISRKIFNCIY